MSLYRRKGLLCQKVFKAGYELTGGGGGVGWGFDALGAVVDPSGK